MLSLRTSTLRRAVSGVQLRHGLRIRNRAFTGEAFDREWGLDNALQTLAIETSCDDTSVAVLSIQRRKNTYRTKVTFHERITSNSAAYGGIHPIVALESHQRNLGQLVKKARKHMDGRPDFITVTRGPGMRSNLSVGLEMAKGLSLGWAVPLVGVHHMQAHALTPRLCSVIKKDENPRINPNFSAEWTTSTVSPRFPFLTVLASGGHTMLVSSNSLTQHQVLAETGDIALGDCLDKAARAILPTSDLKAPYGKALEEFAFPDDTSNQAYDDYKPPRGRREELERQTSPWGWSIGPPLAESKGSEKSSRRMIYSFAGVLSTVQRIMEDCAGIMSLDERRDLARETMRIVFEHLASRILLHLSSVPPKEREEVTAVVISGGVAANSFLRHVIRSTLDVRGYQNIQLNFPPPELCTDNALMIAWAGMEMFDAGYESKLSIEPIRRWSLDSQSQDGVPGVLGAKGWVRREGYGDPSKKRSRFTSDGRYIPGPIMKTVILAMIVPVVLALLALAAFTIFGFGWLAMLYIDLYKQHRERRKREKQKYLDSRDLEKKVETREQSKRREG